MTWTTCNGVISIRNGVEKIIIQLGIGIYVLMDLLSTQTEHPNEHYA